MRVHDDPAGHQARPTVRVVATGVGARLAVLWEDGDGRPAVRIRTYTVERR
jgi:hypothetical protein